MVNPFLKEHNPTTLLPDPHCRETESCGASLYLNQHTLARKTRRWKPYTLWRELKHSFTNSNLQHRASLESFGCVRPVAERKCAKESILGWMKRLSTAYWVLSTVQYTLYEKFVVRKVILQFLVHYTAFVPFFFYHYGATRAGTIYRCIAICGSILIFASQIDSELSF